MRVGAWFAILTAGRGVSRRPPGPPRRVSFASPRALPGGFTLLELLAVVSVLGILFAVASPSLARLTAPYRTDEEIGRLRATLLEARARAIAERREYRVVVEAGRLYRVERRGGEGWESGGVRRLPKDMRLTVAGASSATFTFLPRGDVDPRGTLLLTRGERMHRIELLPGGLLREPVSDP